MTGYCHYNYAQSLSEFGSPRCLPQCGGWVLERAIPGFPYRDAMGCYPIFCCQDWSQLQADLDDIDDLVSLALVTDPFGGYSKPYLHQCFDVVTSFKEHFVVDLTRTVLISAHHRRNVRRGLKQVSVEWCENPAQFINEWVSLYDTLIERHTIEGISAFSEPSFKKQLSVPGIVAFRAIREGITVGMILWYVQGEAGYYHLGAFSDLGYKSNASFALFWTAIEHFTNIGLKWLSLGAGAGIRGAGTDGLTRFKKGWSVGARTAYFCGRIFDKEKYVGIVEAKNIPETIYFPAYRLGEFS